MSKVLIGNVRGPEGSAGLPGLPGVSPVVDLGARSGALSLSTVPLGSIVKVTLSGSVTIPASGRPHATGAAAGSLVLRVQQDATGGRGIIAEGVQTPGGVPLAIASGPGQVSLVTLLWTSVDWWLIDTAAYGAVPAGW